MGAAQMAHSVLGDLRVVELADNPAGEMTGRVLAEWGAEVIKIEPLEGAPSRHTGPFSQKANAKGSLHFAYYNTSKQSLAIDVEQSAGRRLLEMALDRADIFIHTLGPSEASGLEMTAVKLSKYHRLVVCSITAFGKDGPWAEYKSSDLIALAAGGPLNSCGYDEPWLPPIRPGGNQGYHVANAFALNAILLGLLQRLLTGKGCFIDLAVHDCLAVTTEMANPYWFYTKSLVRRQTGRHASPIPTAPAVFRCGDGRYVYFMLITAEDKPWRNLVEWMDSKGLATDLTDPAYSDLQFRKENYPHIQEVLESFAAVLDADTFFREAQARGLPVGVIQAPEDLLADPHLRERRFFVSMADQDLGEVIYPGAPYRFTNLSFEMRGPAPRLGEHTDEILTRVMQLSATEINELKRSAVARGQPSR
jgi:crotonobetainyl-CoA:carnitine CoA-transferase CaiB-like acyl-CoA transferase